MRQTRKILTPSSYLLNIVLLLISFIIPPSVFAQSTVGSWTHTGLTGVSVSTVVSDPTDPNILFAGTSNGVYKSTDGGDNWTATANQGTDASVVKIAQTNHTTLYATLGGSSTGVQKSTDGGTTWANVTNNMVAHNSILDLAVDPTNADVVYVAAGGQCPGIQKTTNGGSTWTAIGGGCDLYGLAIDPSNSNTIYAGGTNFSGYFEKSTDGGSNWTVLNSGLGSPGAVYSIAVDANNSGVIYVGSEASGVYKTTDGGTSWSLLSNSPSVQIGFGLTINQSDSSIYAKSSSGVAKSTDGGATWTDINSGQTPSSINRLFVLSNYPYDLYAGTGTGLDVYGLQTPPTPTPSQSATIASSPFTGTKTVGMPFNVLVTVNSNVGAFNASRATVSVSSNLTVSGLHNATSNACNFQYTKTPTTSDASFAGAIFGSSSSTCNVYTVTLTPNAAGEGTISFTNGSIKAYSDNSEILTGVQNASFTINAAGDTPTPTSALSQLTVTSPLETYLISYNLSGTKDTSISSVFVDGSSTGVIYPTDTTWRITKTLSLGNNPFTIYGADSNGNQTATQNITISRHTLGDINGDGVVDLVDASLMAVDWDKTSDLTYILSDMNNDGTADLTDLSILAKLETE